MKAAETRVDRFLASNETAFAIPVYQRNYDWTRVQCQQLFADIIAVGKDDTQSAHFIGSIVYVHDDVYTATGLTELTIIDGQQRLTTLTLIFIAIYRFYLSQGQQSLATQIYKTYLINEFSSEPEKLKLKPTDNNKAALAQILDPDEARKIDGYSKLIENFQFFQNQINQNNVDIVMRGIRKLIFVDIALDRQKDNPQRIFESLNSTGLELSQADLIRNYILMGLPRKEQEETFKNFWEIIESNARNVTLNESRVSDFIRDFLTLKQKEIPNKGAVYEKFKERYPTPSSQELLKALEELRSLSAVYRKLLNPAIENRPHIRQELLWIKTLEINVAYPFLMPVYQDFEKGDISQEVFLSILQLIQSFVWRRFIVGLPTNALNKIFMVLYDRIDRTDYLASIQRYLLLRTGSQRFPRDSEIEMILKDKDIYSIKSRSRTYFYERLENHKNNEYISLNDSTLTVEHIFPQNPDSSWTSNPDKEALQEIYLNTIGNLTLSGNNGKLGNKSFIEKRDMNDEKGEQGYRFSRLWLNRDLKELDEWGVDQVKARADRITKRFLEVWPLPSVSLDEQSDGDEVNIFDAEQPRNKRLKHASFLGNRLEVSQVTDLYRKVFTELLILQPDAFSGTKLGERLQLTKDAESLRQAIHLGDETYIEGNIDSSMKFQRIKLALTELDLEEELFIKFV
jgi:uncharacterized protein with ParB-like and HNH nuclease domain